MIIRLVLLIGAMYAGAVAATPPVNTEGGSFAINGYDTVAYFTQGEPIKGDPAFVAEYQGAQWLFANPEHKAKFESNPEKYAPQFGGFCAFAAAHNSLAPTDPTAWSIVDDKLYLNYNKGVQSRWLDNVSGYISKGESFWLTQQ